MPIEALACPAKTIEQLLGMATEQFLAMAFEQFLAMAFEQLLD